MGICLRGSTKCLGPVDKLVCRLISADSKLWFTAALSGEQRRGRGLSTDQE